MQGHQRWWAKTAEKFESNKSKTGEKLRRKSMSKRSNKDNKYDIFSTGNKSKSSQSLSLLGSTSPASDSSCESDLQFSDWSSVSSEDEPTDNEVSYLHADVQSNKGSSKSKDNSEGTQPQQPNVQPDIQPSSDPKPDPYRPTGDSADTKAVTTKRKGSLVTEPYIASRQCSDEPHLARKSLESGTSAPKYSSLRKVAVTKHVRSVTWQAQEEPEADRLSQSDISGAKSSDSKSSDSLSEIPTQRIPHIGREEILASRSSASRWGGSRRALAAKVKAYYQRHAQISETTAILSTRAVVRLESASDDAYMAKYNEATCQKYRRGVQVWTEMWLALTKRGILFYLTSAKRPTVQICFPPYIAIAPRISLFSTLDLSLAIAYYSRHDVDSSAAGKKGKKPTGIAGPEDPESKRDGVRIAIVKFPSSQIACEWYREIGQILLVGRALYSYCYLGPIPAAAQPPPSSVLVSIPELGCQVEAKLGRHSAEIPNSLIDDIADSHAEYQWRCETTTVWHIRRDVINALLADKVLGPQIQQWIDAEEKGLITIGVAWRRFDRLDWVMPCGVHNSKGKFHVGNINELVVGPQLLEGTHGLELRILEHYPDSVCIDKALVNEPLAVEGYLDVSANGCGDPSASRDGRCYIDALRPNAHDMACTAADGEAASEADAVVRYYHPDERTCAKQMSLAKYMLDITLVDNIVPMSQSDDQMANGKSAWNGDEASIDADDRSSLSIQTTANSNAHGSPQKKSKHKVLGFLRSKKNRQTACKLKLTTREGAAVVIWTSSEDQVCSINYVLQGRRSREKDMPDWNYEKAWADRAVWHACLMLGCRNIIMSGMLYRKRHRHQGMRKVFCILTHGRLVEYKYPEVPATPLRSLIGKHVASGYTQATELLDELDDFKTSRISGSTSGVDALDSSSNSSKNNSRAHLLFARSRTLSLKRCYVMSRFIDDLTTQDIMCEPWVMADISNYSGLRLADRLYSDGIVSHELVQDCIFTVWRPIFVPAILRSGKTPKIKAVPEEALRELSGLSEESHGEHQAGSASSESKASSPNINSSATATPILLPRLPTAISFESDVSARENRAASSMTAAEPSLAGRSSPAPGSMGRQKQTDDPPRRSRELGRKSSETTSRHSGDGYLSSVSSKSGGKAVDASKPGAYRTGDKITVNVDDRHDGIKRMGAIGMVSGMRRRLGVYKARTSAEMEQWVVAINQEIRRMAAADNWS
ncbi:hypothetical protein GGI12_003368 [Dipsacomyces acuminosporus]|nr:hypothetical protein GGI12_003368 [Dipsacomyces acuminosporus]